MVRGILLGVVAVLLAVAPATAASAAPDYVGSTPPVVKGTEVARPAPRVLAQEADPDPDDRIPITGGDVMGLAAIGAGSLALGLALTRRARRPA